MLTTIFLSFISFVIGVIANLFSAIQFLVPTPVISAFNTFFGYVNIGDGIFPFSQALLAILAVLTLWVLLYVARIILWVYSLLPIIGRAGIGSESHHVTEGTSESFNSKGQSLGTRKYRSERK